MNLVKILNSALWGPFTSLIILITGGYLCSRCKFFYILHPIKTVKHIFNSKLSSSCSQMLTALGGSIGVGNITGVALALSLGGAGAIFWMWVCATLTMILKYGEIVLAVKYSVGTKGGGMYYLQKLPFGKFFSKLFCVCCIITSFGIGCAVQSNAVAESAKAINVSPVITAVIISSVIALVVFKNTDFLSKITKVVVPLMSFIYIGGAIFVIISNFSNLPSVFLSIFKNAFGIDSIVGGFSGAVFSAAIRHGMAKGIFSGESGMGSSAIAYAHNNKNSPHVQGVWGVFEVFIDTIVMCTLTAVAILSSKTDLTVGSSSVQRAFISVLGEGSLYFIALSMFFFAATSMMCWNFYAKNCIESLTDKKIAVFVYNVIFVAVVAYGALGNVEMIWELSDLFNAIMLGINILGIIYLKNDVISCALSRQIISSGK